MNYKNLLQAGYRYAYSLVHDSQRAEDLVQDAWIKIMKNQGKVTSKSLLYTSIKHLFIDEYRKSKTLPDEGQIEIEDIQSPIHFPEIGFSQNEINQALDVLKSNEREMLFLHVYEGYRIDEIASSTNNPRGTILSTIHRAKNKLKVKLEHIIQHRNTNVVKFKVGE